MMGALFNNPIIAKPATWTPQGGSSAPIQVVSKSPDTIIEYGASRILSDSLVVDIRVSDALGLTSGDAVTLDGVVYAVQGEPKRDRDHLIWTVELVPA